MDILEFIYCANKELIIDNILTVCSKSISVDFVRLAPITPITSFSAIRGTAM